MIKHPELRDHNTLNVIAVVSNPVRFHSRYRLFHTFREHMRASGVNLIVVEAAFGDRHHECTSANNPQDVQLRTSHELWHKENMINLGVRRLHALIPDWKYVAWIDADIEFINPNWAQETVHQLQHHMVVQLFRDAIDLGPTYAVLETRSGPAVHRSFCYQYVSGAHRPTPDKNYGRFWHPGYAWAARREFFENMGGLIDFAILGAGDNHMALCMIGQGRSSIPQGLHKHYADRILTWERLCTRRLHRNLGFVDGTILHHWHGPKKKRYYIERWKVLQKHQFDPESDLAYDAQGLLILADPTRIGLRNDIRAYFRARHEDSPQED